MPIDLGPIQIDDKSVLKQLKHDLKDDWFPDPRNFEDVFTKSQLQAVIAENFKKNAGVYRPLKRTLLNIPKSNFTLRYGLETSISDRVLYHGMVATLVPYFDPLLPWNVFNHRAASQSQDRYLFKRAVPAWQDFIGVVRSALTQGTVLLSTDLANYFENISIKLLRDTLEGLLPEVSASAAEKAKLRSYLDTLFGCLSQWCFSESHGLPQNRDASSFLANIYLLGVDRAMIGHGYTYFRYMDDIKVVCEDEFAARQTLKKLSLSLRAVGLSVNSGKFIS